MDYDEHDSFLVITHDKERAKAMIKDHLMGNQPIDNFYIKKLSKSDFTAEEIILDSFNAG